MNKGVEAVVNLTVMDRRNFGWDMTWNGSHTTNKILSLGVDASPNHHELALRFAFSDNFFLEPSVSSDGHRWLTGQYTTESEETHWPASYGGKRNDSGDDPEVIRNYPGRGR